MKAQAVIPEGFRYAREFITPEEEAALLREFRNLPFQEFRFQGFTAKRRVVSYGYHYSFESFAVTPAEPIPEFLERVRGKTADWMGCAAGEIAEALVTEYPPGAAIGWHRDVAPFEKIAGISLGSLCTMRFRTGKPGSRKTFFVPLEERSIYLLSGESREKWEHHIPLTRALRYSITFRTLKAQWKKKLKAA